MNLPSADRSLVRYNVQRGAEFIQGDLVDTDVAIRAIDGADYVLH